MNSNGNKVYATSFVSCSGSTLYRWGGDIYFYDTCPDGYDGDPAQGSSLSGWGASGSFYSYSEGTCSRLHDEPAHFWDFRGCTTGAPVTDSIVGGSTSTDFSSATSIFIEVDSILNLYEVEARDAGGNRIVPTSATLSSTLNSNYPASECIDQVTNSDANMCHTYVPDSDPWLRIDYPAGALTNLNSIVIYNRWGHRDRSSRLPNFLSRRQEQRY